MLKMKVLEQTLSKPDPNCLTSIISQIIWFTIGKCTYYIMLHSSEIVISTLLLSFDYIGT